jgi:predicted nucleic acid-binding protein
MLLLVDVNVLLSSLVSRGDSFRFFFYNSILKKFNLIAPEYAVDELVKHKDEIIKRAILPSFIVKADFEFILENLLLINESVYQDKIEEAKEILIWHQKDAPYLALALKFNCYIFSGDKVFKQLCPEKVRTPKEILNELFK